MGRNWNEKKWEILQERRKKGNFISTDFQFLDDLAAIVKHYSDNGKPLEVITDLVGARWSGKSQSAYRITSKMVSALNSLGLVVMAYIIRFEPSGAKESMGEVSSFKDEVGAEGMNKSDKIITFGDSKIKFVGFTTNTKKSQAKLGLERGSNVDVVIKVYDEIIEFASWDQVQQVEEAIGGGDIDITMRMANPFSIFNFYIAHFVGKITIDKKKMDEEGFMFKSKWTVDETTKVDKLETIHWSNHWANEYLSATQHKKLIDLWKRDPKRAAVVERGEMGMEKGGIYSDYADKITEPPNSYIPREWFIGVDVGIRRDATTAYLCSINQSYTAICIHGEYYHSLSERTWWLDGKQLDYMPRDQESYAHDITSTVINWYKYYRLQDYLPIQVDNSSALYETINKVLGLKRIPNTLIYAEPCVKIPILRRIDAFHYLMSGGKFYVNKSKCPKLMTELMTAQWDEALIKKQRGSNRTITVKRLDGKDHGINAVEYGFGEKLLDILNNPSAEFYRR